MAKKINPEESKAKIVDIMTLLLSGAYKTSDVSVQELVSSGVVESAVVDYIRNFPFTREEFVGYYKSLGFDIDYDKLISLPKNQQELYFDYFRSHLARVKMQEMGIEKIRYNHLFTDEDVKRFLDGDELGRKVIGFKRGRFGSENFNDALCSELSFLDARKLEAYIEDKLARYETLSDYDKKFIDNLKGLYYFKAMGDEGFRLYMGKKALKVSYLPKKTSTWKEILRRGSIMFKTPSGSMRVCSDVILEALDDPDTMQDYARRILKASKYLSENKKTESFVL